MLAFIAQDLHEFIVLARLITARVVARLFLNFWTTRVNVLIHLRVRDQRLILKLNNFAYDLIRICAARYTKNLLA